ncbi:MAG: N-acetyltransferase [Deltaproteobacteria bacterium]|nr:N-acetyltransferase [Deltaproteobacteria bacterium]
MKRISSDVVLGDNVRIADFVNLYGCRIGDNSRIGPFVEIQKGASVGGNCKISSHSFICEGVAIQDGVFIGHSVTFTNDRYPRATNADGTPQADGDWRCIPTVVKRGASIGSGATLLCGIVIGEQAMIGAGSVVTRDVPAGCIAAGNPARVVAAVQDRMPRPAGRDGHASALPYSYETGESV